MLQGAGSEVLQLAALGVAAEGSAEPQKVGAAGSAHCWARSFWTGRAAWLAGPKHSFHASVALIERPWISQVAAVLEESNSVWVFDWPSGSLSGLLAGHLGHVDALSACPTLPHTVAAGSCEWPPLVCSTCLSASHAPLHAHLVPTAHLQCGRLLLRADDDTVRVWDLRTAASTHMLVTGSSVGVAALALAEDQVSSGQGGGAMLACGACPASYFCPASARPAAGRAFLLLSAARRRGDPGLGSACPRTLPV